MKILLVLGTIRTGRQSENVALFLQKTLLEREGVEVDYIDLKELDLPVLWERHHHMEDSEKPAALVRWHKAVDAADGIVLVAPEYNGGYPAALKNVLDALYSEYHRKPFAVTSVSSGFGGYTVITQLREIIHRFKGILIPATFMARNVSSAFDEAGNCTNEHYPKGANGMINDLLFYAEAIKRESQRINSQ